jgi:RHS repeat-associated protein
MSHTNDNPIGLQNLPYRFWAYDRDGRGLVVTARSPGGWVLHVNRDERCRWREVRDAIALIARSEYDEFGYETKVLDAAGLVSRTRYDDLHRPLEVTNSSGEVTRYQYNAIGRMTERIGPGDQRETWQYDRLGHLVAHTNALGHTVKMDYDREGLLTAITNSLGERLEYRRDLEGRIVEEKLFDGRIQRYEYNPMGRRVKIELSDGRTILQQFDRAGRVVCRESSDDLVEEFAYDKEGRAIKACNNHAVVELKRDHVGRIVEEVQNGRSVLYKYDGDGNRIHRTLPFEMTGAKLIRVFDVRGRMVAFWDDGGPVQEFRWDNIDRLIQRRCPGGLLEVLTYDSERRLQQQRVETMAGRIVRAQLYDSSGNIASLQEQLVKSQYTYDPLNRLSEVRRNGVVVEAYDYDANNGLRATRRGPRRVGAGGRTLEDGSRELTYGEDGAVAAIRAGKATTILKHDVNGRLVEVVGADGIVSRYEYDPFGRRTAKVVGPDRTEFLWEAMELAAELPEGKAPTIYISLDIRPLAQWKAHSRLTLILDQRGAVQEVFDEFSHLRWSCALDAYGNLLSQTGDTPNPFRLRGQYYDAETGLYYNYNRHYDPTIGDYTAPDPIGVKGGNHFYAYPRNPLRWDDPFGLECPPGQRDPNFHADEVPPLGAGPRGPWNGTPDELNARFGVARPPWTVRDDTHPDPNQRLGEGVRPPEAQVVRPGEPLDLPPYTAPNGQPGRYIWVIDENGNMIVAPEWGSSTIRNPDHPRDGQPRRTTHVDLTNKGPGRIGGEINPTGDPNLMIMNDDSGRYSRQVAPNGTSLEPTRTGDQLRNANDHLNTADRGNTTVLNTKELE